jgi:hypothetical protein
MSEFKGTKEPWVYEVTKKNKIVVKIGLKGNFIQLGTIYDDDCNNAKCCKIEEHANALLISKAPEMLEMLKELCNDTETWSHLFPSQQEKIEQLIKEATKIKNK